MKNVFCIILFINLGISNIQCSTFTSTDSLIYDELLGDLIYWYDLNPLEKKSTDSLYQKFKIQFECFIRNFLNCESNYDELSKITLLDFSSVMNSHYDDHLDEIRWKYRRSVFFAYLALISKENVKLNYLDLAIYSTLSVGCKRPTEDLENVFIGLKILEILIINRDLSIKEQNELIRNFVKQHKDFIKNKTYKDILSKLNCKVNSEN